jgi:SAM-dependent methyltransferase
MATLQQIHRAARAAEPHGYLLDPRTELDRLTLQAKVWEPAAEQMIAEIGVASGWRAVDLGCGVRGILEPLADAVDTIGTVIGVDNDPLLLSAARAWATERSLHNVWLFQDDAFRTDLPRGIYDLVHARFLFAPLGREEALLKEMIDLTRPGGVIAVQEPDSSSWNCNPRRAGFDALKPAILRAFRAGGGDFDAGTRIFDMLRRAGLEDVQVRAHVLALPPGHPYRRLPVQFANSLRRRVFEGELLTASQFSAAIADCEAAADDASTVFTSFTLMQAWGRKPA